MRLFLIALVLCAAPVAHAAPRGAVRLSGEDIFASGNFYCGRVKGNWLPGRLLSEDWFFSYEAQRRNLRVRLRAAEEQRKRRLQRQMHDLQTLIVERSEVCAGGPPASMQLNLSDAIGIALEEPLAALRQRRASNAPSSNLRVVDAAGLLHEAFAAGEAVISKFFIASNKRLYLLFFEKTDIGDGAGDACFLAEIEPSTGIPRCLDTEAADLYGHTDAGPKNDLLQVDDLGAVYYIAQLDFRPILRKYVNGSVASLSGDDTSIDDFLTLPDGNVLIYGASNTGVRWLRRVDPSGAISTVADFGVCDPHLAMRHLPDDRILVVLEGCGYVLGVYQLDPNTWTVLTPATGDLTQPVDRYGAPAPSLQTPLGISDLTATTNGILYGALAAGLFRIGTQPGELGGGYHTIVAVSTNLAAAGAYGLYLINTGSGAALPLITANYAALYHVHYLAEQNKIYYDAQRLVDSRYIIGQVNLGTMHVATAQTGDEKLVDFQIF